MAGDTRMEWTTRAITIRATRMDVAKFSSDIPTSRAAGIAPGIPHTEAAGAASRTSYPQAARGSCIASRLTRPGREIETLARSRYSVGAVYDRAHFLDSTKSAGA